MQKKHTSCYVVASLIAGKPIYAKISTKKCMIRLGIMHFLYP